MMDKPIGMRFRSILRWIGRIVLGLLLTLVLLVGVVSASGAVVRSRIAAKYAPLGEMVDVGDYRLHIYCQGQGSPTVVLLSGSGMPSPYWWPVQTQIAETTRVCAYDRAGYAWSDDALDDMSPSGQVQDLKLLLTGADIGPPYVLVGHSYGGYVARLFAQTYSDEVAGLVMIDSAHEEQFVRYPEPIRAVGQRMFTGPNSPIGVFLAGLYGSLQAILPSSGLEAEYLPEEVADIVTAMRKLRPQILYTVKAEVTVMVQGKAPPILGLGDIPLVVITHGVPIPQMGQSDEVNAEYERIGLELQKELLSLSSNSKQLIAEDSNHDEIPLKQTDLVVRSILEVLEAKLD